MKKIQIKIGIIFSVVILLSSCSSWLEVEPKAKIKSDQLFETEQGYKDALIGCYEAMSEKDLYGGELSCLFLEALAKNYDFRSQSRSPYNYHAQYNYTNLDVQTTIRNVWLGMYNVICNVNKIIEEVEINKSKLTPTKYSLIKGEAYGLRAFLYTDLVRLFTWGNLAERGAQLMNELAIPYPKEYSKNIVKQSTLKEVLDNIHSDLDVAYELLNSYDPLAKPDSRPEDYENPSYDDAYYATSVRPYRINIKGVLATRMRLNFWEGNYEAAYSDANYLINTLTTPWISDSNINNPEEAERDLTFSVEQIFGVETYNRFDSYIYEMFSYRTANQYNYRCFVITSGRAKSVYEVNENIGTSDYRYTRWIGKDQSRYTLDKYWEFEDQVYANQQPVIKKSEVYYTAVECLMHMSSFDPELLKTVTPMHEAVTLLNEVRMARGIPDNYLLSYDISKENLNDELKKEYLKEFLGDGQMFYYYKRLGISENPFSTTPMTDYVFVLPLPDTEIDMGNREQLTIQN